MSLSQPDFIPRVLGVENSAVVFMRGSMNGVLGVWVRDKRRYVRLSPPGDFTRLFNPVVLSWGVRPGQPVRHAALVTNASGNLAVAEAFRLLDEAGRVLGAAENGAVEPAFERLAAYSASLASETKDPAVVAPAERYGASQDIAISDVPYRVDKNAGANPWLSVGALGDTYFSWHYDLPGGTPAGFFDLRPACQNIRVSPPGIEYPPPAKKQSDIVSGSADVGCFRWVPNPTHDPTEPFSPAFTVESYAFAIDPNTAPPDAPAAYGSTWEAIDTGSLVVEVEKHYSQIVTFSILGGTWHEDASELVWLLRKNFSGLSRFRYKYDVEFNTVHVGTPDSTDPGRIYQREQKSWGVHGVRTFRNGMQDRDDAPNGIEALSRADEEAFPSGGGNIVIAQPTPTSTMCVHTGTTKPRMLVPYAIGRAGGDFWVPCRRHESSPLVSHLQVVTASAVIDVPGVGAGARDDVVEVVLREISGRVWAFVRYVFAK